MIKSATFPCVWEVLCKMSMKGGREYLPQGETNKIPVGMWSVVRKLQPYVSTMCYSSFFSASVKCQHNKIIISILLPSSAQFPLFFWWLLFIVSTSFVMKYYCSLKIAMCMTSWNSQNLHHGWRAPHWFISQISTAWVTGRQKKVDLW